MAEEDDVDVEGDFIFTDSVSVWSSELPSEGVNLQPEFSQHPWILEQGWTLDHCADERSKAAIEKMLQEEQHYISGARMVNVEEKLPSTSRDSSRDGIKSEGSRPARRAWTQEEKELFHKGMGIFGRQWAKIAELIPGKTGQQVKSFAYQFFRNKEKQAVSAVATTVDKPPSSLQEAITAVTTASPTVTSANNKCGHASVSPRKRRPKPAENLTQLAGPKVPAASPAVKQTEEVSNQNCSSLDRKYMDPQHEVVKISRDAVSESEDEEIDIDDDDGDGCLKQEVNQSDSLKFATSVSDVPVLIPEGKSVVKNQEMDAGITKLNAVHRFSSPSVAQPDSEAAGGEINGGMEAASDEVVRHTAGARSDCHVKIDTHEKQNIIMKKKPPDLTGTESISCNQNHPNIVQPDASYEMSVNAMLNGELTESLCSQKYNKHEGVSEVLQHNTDVKQSCTENILVSTTKVPPTFPASAESQLEHGNNKIMQYPGSDSGTVNEEATTAGGLTEVEFKTDNDQVKEIAEELETAAEAVDEDSATSDGGEGTSLPGCCTFLTSNGESLHFPIPKAELKIDREETSKEEKLVHSEFFQGRPSKTEQRYMKIRNYLLDSWEKQKPLYLTKTSVRPGLKNCGDVNTIGRIHAYLEAKGAINFGCDEAAYNRPVKVKKILLTKGPNENSNRDIKRESVGVRKRRVRDQFGEWIDEDQLEGRTIQHKEQTAASPNTKLTKRVRTEDPFKLVPCQTYNSDKLAPFTVSLYHAAMIIMDIHSHLSKTEVIGMLGGMYDQQARHLVVTSAEPCSSLSTGMQCEMDPVSQAAASERIRGTTGNAVVGWYHSHPTFPPNPSVRDMETQHKYQEWFSQGGSPFIGVIVSPFDRINSSLTSTVTCLHADSSSQPGKGSEPYAFIFDLSPGDLNISHVTEKIEQLIKEYAMYANRVELLYRFKRLEQVSCLDKMLSSVRNYLPSESQEEFEHHVRNLVSYRYKSDGTGAREQDT